VNTLGAAETSVTFYLPEVVSMSTYFTYSPDSSVSPGRLFHEVCIIHDLQLNEKYQFPYWLKLLILQQTVKIV